MSQATVVFAPEYECDIGPHVFPVVKYRLVKDALLASGDLALSELERPQPATRSELALAHRAEYLDDLAELRWTERTMFSELPLTREIVNAYILAAGGTLRAARGALETGVGINLGGGFHHASADRAEGFCYINDLAVALRVLQRAGTVIRGAVVDLDVHQGNGSALIFAGDTSVFTLSLHQEMNYPMPKAHSTLDIGLEDGTTDEPYLAALDGALERVWTFDPELVLYQAGADPYRDDQLGGLALTRDGLERRDRMVLEGCASRGIPAVVTLGGGYARNTDDTVAIQATTCRIALERVRARRAP